MKLQPQLKKIILNILLSETEGADPKNPDSHPDLDDWGPDSWWTFADWKVWYNVNVQKYGEIEARKKFTRHWMAVEEGTGVGTKNDIDIAWLKLNHLWHSTKNKVYTRDEMLMYEPKKNEKIKKVEDKKEKKQNYFKSEVTKDSEYIIIKSDSYKGNQVHVFFGGSHTSGYSEGKANLSAMSQYIPILKPYSNNKIIVITHHFNSLNTVKKYIKQKFDGEVSSIAGFSQGGRETWNYADDGSLRLVGLVDPSTYEINIPFGPNTYLVCDPKNWGSRGFYGETKERLNWYCNNKDKYGSHVICFYKGGSHMNFGILKYFYEKFGNQI